MLAPKAFLAGSLGARYFPMAGAADEILGRCGRRTRIKAGTVVGAHQLHEGLAPRLGGFALQALRPSEPCFAALAPIARAREPCLQAQPGPRGPIGCSVFA